ncbi:hypothetical protein BJ322DRAFT_634987 [Thelephora terrestris]|uniref:Uncharacterized protein n=1 Tax=Thelephora terrestris TaxID=56493 RepID=A0A9P6L9J8_9AGAM|nr:hypothetical protein BJ322DRAFT_634987 [Thelephora terrestris]
MVSVQAPATTNGLNQDPTGVLIGTTITATTQVVNSTLDRLLSASSSPSTGIPDIDKSLEQIRKDLGVLTSTQSSEQDEIKTLLEDSLNNEVLQHISAQIERQIDTCIDETVNKLVEEELDKYVPKDVRSQVDKQRTELLTLQIQIHNSEARRSNSFIKTQKHFNENLQYLLDQGGRRSDIFPRTVNELLAYNDQKVLQLVQFFGMEHPDNNSKIPNLNWFLRIIGVTYQSNLLG